jgi:hypothetical protein
MFTYGDILHDNDERAVAAFKASGGWRNPAHLMHLSSTPGTDGEISEVAWFAVDDLPANITNTAPFAIRDAAAGSRGVFAEITPSRSV